MAKKLWDEAHGYCLREEEMEDGPSKVVTIDRRINAWLKNGPKLQDALNCRYPSGYVPPSPAAAASSGTTSTRAPAASAVSGNKRKTEKPCFKWSRDGGCPGAPVAKGGNGTCQYTHNGAATVRPRNTAASAAAAPAAAAP